MITKDRYPNQLVPTNTPVPCFLEGSAISSNKQELQSQNLSLDATQV